MATEEREAEPGNEMVVENRHDEADDVRAQLRQAQERLATYQAFDRDIAESVRRSSELMLEALQVRQRVDADVTRLADAARTEMDANLLQLRADLSSIRQQVHSALERVDQLRTTLSVGSVSNNATAEPLTVDARGSSTSIPARVPVDTEPIAFLSMEEEDDEPEFVPIRIDLIASGLTRTATALALQSHLRALPSVSEVDAREFSSGILRLNLLLIGPLSDADLHGWEDDSQFKLSRHSGGTIELQLSD